MNCNRCGQPLTAEEQFCGNCGAPRPAADARFQQAEDEFFRLKGQLATGRITQEQFDAAVKELMIQDAQKRYWMLGPDSGKWYVHDGKSWVEAQPPATDSSARKQPSPETLAAQSPRRRVFPIVAIGCLALLCVLVAVGGLVFASNQGFINIALVNAATSTPVVLILPNPIPTLAPSPTTPAPTPTQSITIGGAWESNFGAVTLEAGTPGANQLVNVSGFWIQGDGKQGTIKNGSFDPVNGVLEFTYFQPWNNLEGSARFILAPDGKTLKGTWKQSSGQGDWTMQRSTGTPATSVAKAVTPAQSTQVSPTPRPTALPPTRTPGPQKRLDLFPGYGGRDGVNLIDLATNVTFLVYGEPGIASAAWSPDGTKVLVSSSVPPQGSIFKRVVRTVNADGSNVTNILMATCESFKTSCNSWGPFEAIWSPDGKKILVRELVELNSLVLRNASDGQDSQNLPSSPPELSRASATDIPRFWSVDGQWIIAISTESGNTAFALEVNGKRRVPVSSLGAIKVYDERFYPWQVMDAPTTCRSFEYFNCP